MEKTALCASDTKRCLLDDGFSTLAYGHKNITARVVQGRIINPGADLIIAAKEARELGLVWSRRKGAVNRLGFDPALPNPESDEDALQAGRDMRVRLTQMLNRVDDIPDQLIPQEERPLLRRAQTDNIREQPAPLRRVRLPSDDEVQSEPEPLPTAADAQTQVALNLLFPADNPAPQNQTTIHKHPLTAQEQAGINDFHRIMVRVGAASTSSSMAPRDHIDEVLDDVVEQSSQYSEQSQPTRPAAADADTDSEDLPSLLSKCRRRPTKKQRREQARAFILQEAEEADSTDEDAPRRRKTPLIKKSKAPSRISPPRSDSEHESSSDSDMSFVVGDDYFE